MFSARFTSPTCGSDAMIIAEGTVDARLPGSFGGDDEPISGVVGHGLAQVPDRPVVGLRIEINRGLLQASPRGRPCTARRARGRIGRAPTR